MGPLPNVPFARLSQSSFGAGGAREPPPMPCIDDTACEDTDAPAKESTGRWASVRLRSVSLNRLLMVSFAVPWIATYTASPFKGSRGPVNVSHSLTSCW